MKAAVPVAASAVGFGGLHLFLRHGPCHSRLEKMYSRRKARGLIPSAAEPSVLASQASFRVLNEVHNVLAVRVASSDVFGDADACSTIVLRGTGPVVIRSNVRPMIRSSNCGAANEHAVPAGPTCNCVDV